MNKRELEEHVLGLAKPLLRKLYGVFVVYQEQTDRPDFAINVTKPTKTFGRSWNQFKVGIEITSVDKKKDLAYLNDEKFGSEKIMAQIEESIQHGIDSDAPNKKINVSIPESYIYDGIIKKQSKYSKYAEPDAFRETILLCFSEMMKSGDNVFKDGLCSWTNFLLSSQKFPFDRVLFVGLLGGEPICIYNKKEPLLKEPDPFRFDHSAEKTEGPFCRIGEVYNLNEIFSNDPLISPKKQAQKKQV